MKTFLRSVLAATWLIAALQVSAAAAAETTVLFEQRMAQLDSVLVEGDELLVPLVEAARVTGFEIKPAGACRGELCFPLRRHGDQAVVVERSGGSYLSLTAWARQLDQPVVRDAEHSVWSFGEIPEAVSASLLAGTAPDFALPDRTGKTVRLADFRGKKVMILSWASW